MPDRSQPAPSADPSHAPGPHQYLAALRDSIASADLQLIAEACALLRQTLSLTSGQLASILAAWNQGELASHLIEIAAQTLAASPADPASALRTLRQSLSAPDRSSVADALRLNTSLSVIAESAFAPGFPTSLASTPALNLLHGPLGRAATAAPPDFTENVRRTLVCARVVSLTQAFLLLRHAACLHSWTLDPAAIAQDWNSSTLRSRLLTQSHEAFASQPDLPCLFLDPSLAATLSQYQASWRKALVKAIALGVPMPAVSSALAFYDACRAAIPPRL